MGIPDSDCIEIQSTTVLTSHAVCNINPLNLYKYTIEMRNRSKVSLIQELIVAIIQTILYW